MDKILIADDNLQITKILSEFAKKEGYEPVTVHNGDEVLELFRQDQFSMILLDVMMPKKDGFEVCLFHSVLLQNRTIYNIISV